MDHSLLSYAHPSSRRVPIDGPSRRQHKELPVNGNCAVSHAARRKVRPADTAMKQCISGKNSNFAPLRSNSSIRQTVCPGVGTWKQNPASCTVSLSRKKRSGLYRDRLSIQSGQILQYPARFCSSAIAQTGMGIRFRKEAII